MRIAVGGIASESCTFSPLPTRGADFQVAEGGALLDEYPFLSTYRDVT
ncbi:MAG: M81 family metallopeptidase, partial [Anaerolineae bacterium]